MRQRSAVLQLKSIVRRSRAISSEKEVALKVRIGSIQILSAQQPCSQLSDIGGRDGIGIANCLFHSNIPLVRPRQLKIRRESSYARIGGLPRNYRKQAANVRNRERNSGTYIASNVGESFQQIRRGTDPEIIEQTHTTSKD